MSNNRSTWLSAAGFTLVSVVAGVMLSNLIAWLLVAPDDLPALSAADQLVLLVVVVATTVGIAGACYATFDFIRTGRSRQVGIWLFFAAGSVRGEAPSGVLNVLPLSVGFDLQLPRSTIGINFLGVVLLIAYSSFLFSAKRSPKDQNQLK